MTSPDREAMLCVFLKTFKTMPDLETALAIIAHTIKSAGYSTRIRCNAVEVSLKRFQVHPYQVQRVLDDAGMEDLYTTNYACGSTFVRPIIA